MLIFFFVVVLIGLAACYSKIQDAIDLLIELDQSYDKQIEAMREQLKAQEKILWEIAETQIAGEIKTYGNPPEGMDRA